MFPKGTTVEGMKPYDPTSLDTMLNLAHHDADDTADEALLKTLVSIFLAKCLGLTRFEMGGSRRLDPGEEQQLSVLLYRLLNSLPANTHEIGYLQTPVLDKWSNMADYKPLGKAYRARI